MEAKWIILLIFDNVFFDFFLNFGRVIFFKLVLWRVQYLLRVVYVVLVGRWRYGVFCRVGGFGYSGGVVMIYLVICQGLVLGDGVFGVDETWFVFCQRIFWGVWVKDYFKNICWVVKLLYSKQDKGSILWLFFTCQAQI